MMGTQPRQRQPALFAYAIDLERRVGADHLLRRVAGVLDLSFVLPAVSHCYGRCGNVSLDPRIVMKIMLLLFLYDVPSERELMEQMGVRLDFLWFLGFDLDTDIPDHSVLSKARARWGGAVFEALFVEVLGQCVAAGLVNGRLLHVDSTIVKANAHKDSVVSSGPELVQALRHAYQAQAAKLEVWPGSAPEKPAAPDPSEPSAAAAEPELRAAAAQQPQEQLSPPATWAGEPTAQVPPPPGAAQPKSGPPKAAAPPKLPVNSTHISTTDPLAELARNKSGVTELNYKDHRLVDDAYGVITALAETTSNVGDGSMLPELYEQHLAHTQLKVSEVTLAGDGHYGTASNYLYCEEQGVRAHLAEVTAHLAERGKLPVEQFTYEPERDRLRCPQGHYLVRHQDRPELASKVYLIEDPAYCAGCPLGKKCTKSKRGRSLQRHDQAELIEAARQEAHSPAARYSRRRRRHVMEGSFADAHNNHGAKKARWRGLARQQIQGWLIAAVQNLRILLRHGRRAPAAEAAKLVELLAKVSGHLQVVGSLDFRVRSLSWSSLVRCGRRLSSGISPRIDMRYGRY
jgi:transposase